MIFFFSLSRNTAWTTPDIYVFLTPRYPYWLFYSEFPGEKGHCLLINELLALSIVHGTERTVSKYMLNEWPQDNAQLWARPLSRFPKPKLYLLMGYVHFDSEVLWTYTKNMFTSKSIISQFFPSLTLNCKLLPSFMFQILKKWNPHKPSIWESHCHVYPAFNIYRCLLLIASSVNPPLFNTDTNMSVRVFP